MCRQGPGGNKVESLGRCPVSNELSANGLNGGVNGGRMCWIVAEACSKSEVKCSELQRKSSCFSCEFRYKVAIEEGLLNMCETTGHFLLNLSLSKSREGI